MIFTRVVSDELFARAGARTPRRVWRRARDLPAVRMPFAGHRRRAAAAVSAILHMLVIWVLVQQRPLTNLDPDLAIIEQGGGGPGPAGGGGGGTRGTGGVKYVTVAVPPPAAVTPPVETVLPPIQPVIEPPKPVLPEPTVPQPEIPKPAIAEPKVDVPVQSPIAGTGGGTGNDGTRGNGPGSGGGVGAGIGTGRGSGVGPGTGGGSGDFYEPVMIEMPIPPYPVPAKVRGTKVIVNFDIDDKGRVLSFKFTPTRDGDYNRKLNDLFKTFKFRPGTTLAGVPIRALYQYIIDFPG